MPLRKRIENKLLVTLVRGIFSGGVREKAHCSEFSGEMDVSTGNSRSLALRGKAKVGR